jgi:hypothetical protein
MGRRSERYEKQKAERTVEQAEAREAIERRWFKRSVETDGLGRLVTGADLHTEPHHRWLPYSQGFSPALVRLFLETAEGIDYGAPAGVLDPFAGSGTTPIECAKANVAHAGVEALEPLAFLARCTSLAEFPPLPDLRGAHTWQEAAERLVEPIHRAALMLAYGRRFDTDGRPRADAPPLHELFNDVVRMIRADQRTPLPRPVEVEPGDARWLTLLDESAGAMLTSPPYLSRHDYPQRTKPLLRVYRAWHADADMAAQRQRQMRAHAEAQAAGKRMPRESHPAELESIEALRIRSLGPIADVVSAYFDDLALFLSEAARVIRPGCPAWVVIGGARMRDVYIPSDLLAAEMAEAVGFEVRELRIARRLISAGRKLGTLHNIAPRETVLILRRT